MLKITRDPFGRGKRRLCYVHPEDPRKAIRLAPREQIPSLRREFEFYKQLKRRGIDTGAHIPTCYGSCKTNLGQGIVVDLVRNHDGDISRTLSWYLANGMPVGAFDACFEELIDDFAPKLLRIGPQLRLEELLVRKTATSSAHLVVTGGLGEAVTRRRFNGMPALLRQRLRREWRERVAALFQQYGHGHG